ncbi:sphingomyelin synthase 1, putative [Hepatocystis sp. ex Piliocolobus tephrosceles]|nr:sphingomyelin synthase 1, putative [Hepatocystis sp. ex Piliocolobus tephrosceles]
MDEMNDPQYALNISTTLNNNNNQNKNSNKNNNYIMDTTTEKEMTILNNSNSILNMGMNNNHNESSYNNNNLEDIDILCKYKNDIKNDDKKESTFINIPNATHLNKIETCLELNDVEIDNIEVKYASIKNKLYKALFVRIIYVLIYGIFCVTLQCYFIILSDTYYKTGETPLKDRVHEIFSEKPSFMTTPFVNNQIIFFLIITLLRFGLFVPFSLGITIYIRIIVMFSTTYLLRTIFIYSTTIPCPVPTCVPLENKCILHNLYSIYLIITAKVYECTDLIISGHTAFTTILQLMWFFYEKRIYLKVIVFIFSFYIYAIIIISRFHYTVDVLMGYMFGTFIFLTYHLTLDTAVKRYALNKTFKIIKTGYPLSFFDRSGIFNFFVRMIAYVEALECRMNISVSYNKEWRSFCSCNPVNSESLVIYKKNENNEQLHYFSSHFYHSYAGDGSFDLTTIRYIKNKFLLLFGIRKNI